MVVGRARERDQDRGLARDLQLGACGGAAAAQHEVRLRESGLHVVEERDHLGLAPEGGVRRGHAFP
jgi:hypothetical protein